METKEGVEKHGFHSQLVGVLTPRSGIDEINTKARLVLETAYKRAGYSELSRVVHGKNLNSGDNFDRFITAVVSEIKGNNWQPVRLLNKEIIRYGEKSKNYFNLLGELIIRIFAEKYREGIQEMSLNLYCALAFPGQDEKYKSYVDEYLAFAAVRQGFAPQFNNWKFEKIAILPANDHRIIQICDVLSNASHNDFSKCGQGATQTLKKAFGVYDYTLLLRLWLEKCQLLIKEGSYGLALKVIAEKERNESQQSANAEDKKEVKSQLTLIIKKLAELTTSERNIQLNLLVCWLEQLINQQRSLELGYKLVQWFKIHLVKPLSVELGNRAYTLDWFSYALHWLNLTACNHKGDLFKAREEANGIRKLLPSLASQWEYISLLMEGLVAEAVHRTDCFEYDIVAQEMKLVASYYHDVSSLFTDAFPEVFPARIHSDLRGKALGTWVQNCIYEYISNNSNVILTEARKLSDICINEFSAQEDKERQYQYRSQLEGAAGEFKIAREYLAKSLRLNNSSHAAIADTIKNLPSLSQGFALLHWLRLGVNCYFNQTEWQDFSAALKQSKLLNNSWCQGVESENYPIHGILRRVALIHLLQENSQQGDAAKNRLTNLKPLDKSLVLGVIQLAMYAEIAAFTWEKNITQSRNLLDNKKDGLKQLLQKLSQKSGDLFPGFSALSEKWLKVVDLLLKDEQADGKGLLLKLAREIGY